MSGTIRIKICGVQDADDAAAAVDAGADLIGVNFVPESKRSVDIRTAEAICERLEGSGVDALLCFAIRAGKVLSVSCDASTLTASNFTAVRPKKNASLSSCL